MKKWTKNRETRIGTSSREDILSNGLFHPVHIEGNDGFLSSNKDKIDEFFGKLHLIMSERKMSVLGGVGELFHLFAIRVKKQKGVPVLSEGIKMTGETGVSGHSATIDTSSVSKVSSVGNGSAVTESTYSSNRLDVETGKSLIGIFERFIEPLMLDLERYSGANLAVPMLLDAAHYTIETTLVTAIKSPFKNPQEALQTSKNPVRNSSRKTKRNWI